MDGLALGGLALLAGLYVWLYYNFLRGPRCRNGTSLRGKTVLITGGNTGIGKATALDLARRGARVILACRSKARAEAAIYDIRRESGNNEVLFMRLDLADLSSVRAFADAFLRSEPRLDILINNAGIVNTELFRNVSIWLKPILVPFSWSFLRDPVNGAQTTIYCATEEGIEKFSGHYFANCKLQEPYHQACDDAVAKKLWRFSEKLLGLVE
ncbi:dehydrogenase/reductase SDR family member 13-like isoform X2 [Paroedura picta]|uniref:dehydrogenase/reductase SDR family member 13-like isoform X2 n=1 Tax=Paroedura picta TaxID=143630 RepID=UPI004057329C